MSGLTDTSINAIHTYDCFGDGILKCVRWNTNDSSTFAAAGMCAIIQTVVLMPCLQGNDYAIRIFDVRSNKLSNTIEVSRFRQHTFTSTDVFKVAVHVIVEFR